MRQILYNNSSQTIRLEFPPEWDPSTITDVTITIKDRDGTELLAADSMTLFTDTTLDGAVSRFADSITLDSGTDAVSPGDQLLIDGASGSEIVVAKGFDSTTKDVELVDIANVAHDDGDNVYGLFATYSLDTSVVATFTKGLLMTLIFTPDGSHSVITEEAQIASSQMEIGGLEKSFRLVYPRAYQAFTEQTRKFADMATEAERQVRQELLSRHLDYNRIVDQGTIKDVLMAKMAWLWVLSGDEQHEDERAVISSEYDKHFEFLCNQPIWADDDQDQIEDDNETTIHPHIFRSGW